MATSAPQSKRVRTCIGCGCKSGKAMLYRIVRKADGTVAFDPTGRVGGRGTYVCSLECLDAAIRGRKVQRALKCSLADGDLVGLKASMAAALEAAMVKE